MRACILCLLISVFGFAQKDNQSFYRNFVEAYYNKQTPEPILIYDDMGGNVVDTLYNIADKNSWYKIAITESEFGWFKMRNIQRLPSSYKNFPYDDHWVKSTNFLVHVDNYDDNHQVYIYDLPSLNSNRIHKMDNFQIVNIIEINDLWSKVKFKVGKKRIEGWLRFKDQCAYPWTTCPKYE
ncbi:hypothetical protein [Psychroserpens algicola]|uniref:hypothetical protein n=1 Tax=Psychroserpens algicola TaxID=1719034 RepID=UPI001954313E|nr:hypothetical protein [Psychroserpens algicola]